MNEPNDKPLHDWVRQTLAAYQPSYEPQGWLQMQRKLRRRQWWRRGIAGILSIVMLLFLYWIFTPATAPPATGSLSRADQSINSPRRIIDKSAITQLSSLGTGIRIKSRSMLPSPGVEPGATSPSPPVVTPLLPIGLPMHSSKSRIAPLTVHLTTTDRNPTPIVYSQEEAGIAYQMETNDFGPDSTMYQTLERNLRQWPNAVVVCDLTTSMYPYSSQVFAWLKNHARQPAIKGTVFFTDCDSLGQQTQPGGLPGRMFITREREPLQALPVMLLAARNTINNKDYAENNVEALLAAQQQFPEATHLILIADNMSRVKDMHRLNEVRKPVHVVLCGTTGGDLTKPYQSDYFTIAQVTKGSLHTIEDDLKPDKLTNRTILRVGSRYYKYHSRHKRFQLTSFDHRPIRILGFIWL